MPPSRRPLDFRAVVPLLAFALASGCAAVTTSPAPRDVGTIVVLPVDNRTGSELHADAPPLLAMLRDDEKPGARVTAPELLADALRDELHARGFRVVAARTPSAVRGTSAASNAAEAGPDAAALDVRLWIWDSSAPSHVLYVDVKLDATLVAADGRVLWESHLPARPIDGGGASSAALAYPEVARRVARLTLGDLAPTAPAATPAAR